uniref:Glycosyl transferase 48 domain-containing protein n=1 Tax=Cucumis sativus TaxID=3659 RepID=A0A0A0KN58_CUCSA
MYITLFPLQEFLKQMKTQMITLMERRGSCLRIYIELTQTKTWIEKVVRLSLLLTVKESAINVPQNLDARRHITFFASSLFMTMPKAPKVLFIFLNLYEWNNFYERVLDQKLGYSDKDKMELIRHWVSYRGQTLSRTVRGVMYYRDALQLQFFLECAGENSMLPKSILL